MTLADLPDRSAGSIEAALRPALSSSQRDQPTERPAASLEGAARDRQDAESPMVLYGRLGFVPRGLIPDGRRER